MHINALILYTEMRPLDTSLLLAGNTMQLQIASRPLPAANCCLKNAYKVNCLLLPLFLKAC